MANPHGLKVGQNLVVVSDDRRDKPREVAIAKVGRVWATLTYGARVDASTLQLHERGFGYVGQCYLSMEAYEAETARNDAWRSLRDTLSRQKMPGGVTLEAINQARALLGLEEGKQ